MFMIAIEQIIKLCLQAVLPYGRVYVRGFYFLGADQLSNYIYS